MSTQINVTVGDQRLLQANKARTAANQQNLDDRLLAKQTEEKAAPLVEAQRAAEETPGSIPVRRIPRRPAAQRKTDLYYGLASATSDNYNFNLFSGRYEDTNDTTYTETWIMPYFYIVEDSVFPNQRIYGTRTYNYTQSLTTRKRTFKAGFYTLYGLRNYQETTPPLIFSTEDVSTNYFFTSTGWYYKYRTTLNGSIAGVGNPTLTGTPPLPPLEQFLRHSGYPVKLASVSVSGTYIYHSMYYMVTEFNFLNRSYEAIDIAPTILARMAPQTFDTQNLVSTWSSSTGPYRSLPYGNIKVYGIYRRTNIETGDVDTRTQILRDYPVPAGTTGPEPPNDYTLNTAYLINQMYADDPRYIAYQQTQNVNTAVELSSNYTYNPTTGVRLVKRKVGTSLEIYSNQLNKGLQYNQLPALPDNWWSSSAFVKIGTETDETIVNDDAVVPYQYIP